MGFNIDNSQLKAGNSARLVTNLFLSFDIHLNVCWEQRNVMDT